MLKDTIKKIDSKQDFINFLKELRTDLKENQGEWENLKLEDYLEAMEAFVTDSDEKKFDDKLSKWRIFANILYGGKIYE